MTRTQPIQPGSGLFGGHRRRTVCTGYALSLVLAVTGFGAAGNTALAQSSHPKVVELFTSEGCSSCPPANKNVLALSSDPNILALSFSVTYWDALGWKDPFGDEAYTRRQAVYEPPLGRSSAFTPQVVVNGSRDVVGIDGGQLRSLVASSPAPKAASVDLRGGSVAVGAGSAPSGGADVWLVRYDPRVVDVPVRRGENSGRTLRHKNVVHDLKRLGKWNGKPATFRLPSASNGHRTAILVQTPRGGPILAAATN